MKKFLPLFLLLWLFVSHQAISQTVYVDGSATGANDGSSWDNAFTYLDAALLSAAPGSQIWVAAGEYRPGAAVPSRESFYTVTGVELYGGFAGTETMLSERNISGNETVLTGDVNGDDLDGDFTNFRTDNCRHVMWVPEGATNSTIIDGFTIRNGQTDDSAGAGDDRRGGGILSYGAPIIQNCKFTQNYGWFAGAVYPRASASSGSRILNCDFSNNQGGSGGAIYVVTNDDVLIKDCIFDSNTSINRGGAIYNNGQSTTVESCIFSNNTGASAGAIYHTLIDDSDAAYSNIIKCEFYGNRGNFGGAASLYGNGTTNVDSCIFDGNTADAGGGALSIGFTNNSLINHTTFVNNQADRGGAIWQQNDTTMVHVMNSVFETNLCLGSDGGAIYQRGSASLRMTSCNFIGNQAQVGGAIHMIEDSVDISDLVLEGCYFDFNIAEDQGGAINISNSHAHISNCVIANSIVSFGETGGAMSTNASGGDQMSVTLLNNSLYGNSAIIGAGVAQWTDGDTSALVLDGQNNIFSNEGDNYAIEGGTPEFNSLGGNLSTDNSLSAYAMASNDFHNSDPLFVDASNDDYRLQEGSPCIDNGTAAGAPATDITGAPRVGNPDIGAYEYDANVGTRNIDKSVNLDIVPNPVVSDVRVSWTSESMGVAICDVYNTEGRLVASQSVRKASEKATVQFNLNKWSAGEYHVMIYQGDKIFVGKLIKQ